PAMAAPSIDSSLGALGRWFDAAERHRIAQAIERRDAVLPFAAHGAPQQIRRARLQFDRGALPSAGALSPQPKAAPRAERDADDILEHRAVAMPADPGARRVFGDERMREGVRAEAGNTCGLVAQRQQKFRDVGGRLHTARREIVMPAERHDATVAEITVKLERLEVERPEPLDQLGFFIVR